MPSGLWKPLSLVPDEQDLAAHVELCQPDGLTEKLWEATPLLRYVNFRVDVISADRTVVSAPPLAQSMLGDAGEQGAVCYLLADQAMGLGMLAALPGCRPAGMQGRHPALPLHLSARSSSLRHLAAGKGSIRAEIEISPDSAFEMRQKIALKGRCQFTHEIALLQGDVVVAIARQTIAAQAEFGGSPDNA